MRTDLEPSESTKREPAAGARQNWLEGGMAILDGLGRVMELNDALGNWLEQTQARMGGRSFWDVLEGIAPEWRGALAKVRQGGKLFERVGLKLSGIEATASLWFTLETARSGEVCFVRLNSTLPPLSELEEGVWDDHLKNDSTRREMYMRLVRAEAQLDRLMRRWPCVIFSQRPDFSLQFVSPNVEELTGISANDWTSQSGGFWDVVHEQDAGELQQQFKRATQGGADITNTYRVRHARTGRVAYILEHRHPMVSKNGLLLGYEVVWLDVTRQTIAERRLSAAAWKETLGVLTLGMAHDFRNIMAGIHSLSESYLSQVDGTHPFQEGLSLIQKNSLQASQLVQRMINLHLGQIGERSYQDLNEMVKDLVELVSKILPRRVRVTTELAQESLPVYADVVELRQVAINLLLNAADAMPQGGTLTLRTSRHLEMGELRHMKGVKPRLPSVCLTVRDTGSGIRERHLASIFDPFFTTKAKGSGLGLYNARLAMEKHHGAISVETAEGAGTSFHLWLPQTDFSEPVDEEASQSGAGRRSILVLGQTGEMLEKTAEFLRSSNFHIVTATGQDSLTELLQSGDYQFSGVMLLAEPHDPMPVAWLEEVRQQKKEMKIVVRLAGCSPDDVGGQLLDGAHLVLNSDLAEADILRKLESLLG